MTAMDWGDGVYELTAQALAPATAVAVEALAVEPGETIADIACGTGNAGLAAARAGARVVGVDPAERLVGVANARASDEGLDARFLVGDGAALPLPDESADAAISVFGAIFVPDGRDAVDELARITRPGGRIVVTSWTADGAIADIGRMTREALLGTVPRPALDWSDPGEIRAAFAEHDAVVEIEEHELAFTSTSPDDWFTEQERHHPMWREAKRALADRPEEWARLRERSISTLVEKNESPSGLRVTSRYLLIHATLPD